MGVVKGQPGEHAGGGGENGAEEVEGVDEFEDPEGNAGGDGFARVVVSAGEDSDCDEA